MGKRQSRDAAFGPDDYNQPTEPMEAIVLPAHYTTNDPSVNVMGIPTPYPGTRPFPQESLPPYPVYQQMPSAPVYPVLPPVPLKKYRGHPPGGSPPINRKVERARHPKFYAGLVVLFFILVRLALVGRIVCMILNVQSTNIWLLLLFQVSDLFVWPARWLAANVEISWLTGTPLLIYLEFLLAILIYWLVSRILSAFVRALLSI